MPVHVQIADRSVIRSSLMSFVFADRPQWRLGSTLIPGRGARALQDSPHKRCHTGCVLYRVDVTEEPMASR